ncbi:MAG: diguanylate cyclase [Alphaproteobacteria bacterium]|nr:diguanylate cyclase [Alphaproteobacteria bacterium]
MSTQKSDNYNVKSVSGAYTRIVLVLFVLLLGAGGLHAETMQLQKKLRDNSAAVQRLFAMTQRVAMLAQLYPVTRDDAIIERIKSTANDLIGVNNMLAPQIVAASGGDVATAKAAISGIRRYIDQGLVFAATAQSRDASNTGGQDIAVAAQDIVTGSWIPLAQNLLDGEAKQVRYMDYGTLALVALALLAVFFEMSRITRPALAKIAQQQDDLEHMSATDMLTQLYNRGTLFKVASMLMSGALRHKRGLAVLVIDIDNFKEINDTYGRTMGDATIRTVAATLDSMLRTSDVIGRVGGTEFAAFLPSTDEYRATFVAEKLRAAIEKLPYAIKDRNVLLHVSIGIAEMQPQHKNPAQMLISAEAAVQHAKQSGRNCIVTQSNMEVVKVQLPAESGGQANDDGAAEYAEPYEQFEEEGAS